MKPSLINSSDTASRPTQGVSAKRYVVRTVGLNVKEVIVKFDPIIGVFESGDRYGLSFAA